jgi:hypothetical protein
MNSDFCSNSPLPFSECPFVTEICNLGAINSAFCYFTASNNAVSGLAGSCNTQSVPFPTSGSSLYLDTFRRSVWSEVPWGPGGSDWRQDTAAANLSTTVLTSLSWSLSVTVTVASNFTQFPGTRSCVAFRYRKQCDRRRWLWMERTRGESLE